MRGEVATSTVESNGTQLYGGAIASGARIPAHQRWLGTDFRSHS